MLDPLATREPVELGPRKALSEAAKLRIWERENRTCWWCEMFVALKEAEFDHKLPRGLLGVTADREENLFPLHGSCHLEKSRGEDWPRITKAKRQAKLAGPKAKSKRPIRGRGFPKGQRKLQSRGFPGSHGRRD